MNVRIRYTDESTVPLENNPGAVNNTVYSFKYTSEANKTIESIDLIYNAGYTYIYLDTLQIEEGTSATSYEPYVEPKTHDIYLDEPLRCIEDVCDYIDLVNKKIERKIKSKPISKSYNWDASYYPALLFYLGKDEYFDVKYRYNMLNSYSNANMLRGFNNQGTSIGFGDSDTYWRFSDVNEMKEWLSDHPDMYVHYVLQKPQVNDLKSLPDITTFKGITKINVDTNIKPDKIEVEYYK